MAKVHFGILIYHPNLCADTSSQTIVPLLDADGILVTDPDQAIELTKEMRRQAGSPFDIQLHEVTQPKEILVQV